MMKRAALVLLLAAAFFGGLVADHVALAARRAEAPAYRPLDAFADVLSHIERSFVDEVDERELVFGAIDGMVARLDPHSQFMRPDAYARFLAETSGRRDGPGGRSVDWRPLDPERRLILVRVRAFPDATGGMVERALAEGRSALGGPLGGLVLDLRDNPGGLVDEAAAVADLFLQAGVIVTEEGRGRGNVDVLRAHAKGTEPAYPLVVLVNRNTASAAEIVAGALQDHGRAVLMGTRTFGKGSVQSIIELGDGSALKLTVARYYTPRHRTIHQVGITPEVEVAEASATAGEPRRDGDADRDPRGTAAPPTPVSAPVDLPVAAALGYLRGARTEGSVPHGRGAAAGQP